MKHKVHPLLERFLIPLEQLRPLPNNPRKGDVDAIAASYDKWGQVRPIVVSDNGDGTYTVVAGNHQIQAAHQLEWTHIAAIPTIDGDSVVSFALADNRFGQLGSIDDGLALKALQGVIDTDRKFFEALGWDDFELAALESSAMISERYRSPEDPHQGWTGPTTKEDEEQQERWSGDEKSRDDLITRGSTTEGRYGGEGARIQHTLVFDNTEQQRIWYDFLRWLKATYDGETTGSQLSKFLSDTLDAR